MALEICMVRNKKCLLCGKPAKYFEFSPDGKDDYFCSKKHWKINADYWHAKGLFWRALELRAIPNEKKETKVSRVRKNNGRDKVLHNR
jgi:hypothetical protein